MPFTSHTATIGNGLPYLGCAHPYPTIDRLLGKMAAQRKITQKAQELIDRLIGLLEDDKGVKRQKGVG